MIDLDTKEMVSAVKIIDLDTEVFAEKIMMALVFEIDGGDIYMEMALMNQDTIVLLQIVVLEFKIRCFGAVIFFLVCRLLDIVIKDKYPWILYQKFGQLS